MDRIKETIVVEGKDDQSAVLAAVDANIICTHGYGISADTFSLIQKAYETSGIIIFTDPDHAGRNIRNTITRLCPNAKQAYLSVDEATKNDDIGIENAKPSAIIKALNAANATKKDESKVLTMDDMFTLGLNGLSDSYKKRYLLGKKLGIGYGNSKTLLKRLNSLGISFDEVKRIICEETEK